ncbi:hypothetical protein KSP40_PGU007348 [Platanthera guangdongensis]|uniref:Uncharacterized protein n=1 Tax=Platanthera guangdongensis TaxID=2320717 RepID=A0ABR2LLX0_9ASPA
MACCRTNSHNLLILHKLSTKSTNPCISSSSSSSTRSAQSISGHEPHTAVPQTSSDPASLFSIQFQTLEACRLGIGRYPDFEYNAIGGIGTAIGEARTTNPADEIFVDFDIGTIHVPPLTGATTRFLGLPLPPLLKIDIALEIFQGTVNRKSGRVGIFRGILEFFKHCSCYWAPPLMVETALTSEESKGSMRRGRGKMMDGKVMCRLVGVANVDPIDDAFMNFFFGLPTECDAELSAQLLITTTG